MQHSVLELHLYFVFSLFTKAISILFKHWFCIMCIYWHKALFWCICCMRSIIFLHHDIKINIDAQVIKNYSTAKYALKEISFNVQFFFSYCEIIQMQWITICWTNFPACLTYINFKSYLMLNNTKGMQYSNVKMIDLHVNLIYLSKQFPHFSKNDFALYAFSYDNVLFWWIFHIKSNYFFTLWDEDQS